MTTTEAGKRLGMSKQGVHYLIETGRLKATREESPRGWYWDIAENDVRKLKPTRAREVKR